MAAAILAAGIGIGHGRIAAVIAAWRDGQLGKDAGKRSIRVGVLLAGRGGIKLRSGRTQSDFDGASIPAVGAGGGFGRRVSQHLHRVRAGLGGGTQVHLPGGAAFARGRIYCRHDTKTGR